MKRFGVGLLCAVAAYLVSAFAGYWLIELLSSNVHDRSVEAAMTSAFVWGPLGALAGFVGGLVWSSGSRAKSNDASS